MEIIQIVLLLGIGYLLYAQRKPRTNTKTRKLILDTCALMDGRIVDLSRSGFVPDELIIPEFILHEMQLLADSSDSYKRERARYGLDIVRELQDSRYCTVSVDPSMMQDRLPTDDRLVALADQLNAQLYTTDYNLQKVAEIKGVRVLNVNELAQNLRPISLPGEKKTVKVLQKGSNKEQGVGYLEDGTMVVVDDGARHVGENVEVEITRIHQTVSGKMLFARLTSRLKSAALLRPKKTSLAPLAARFKRRRST